MTRLKSRQNSAELSGMSNQHTEWKFLATTAFLVATIAVPTLASLLSVDAPERPSILRTTESKNRQPSSVPHLNAKTKVVIDDVKKEMNNLINTSNSINYDFSCSKNKPTQFIVQGSYVQLKGHDCAKNGNLPKLNITNKTNGFTASVFLLSGKEYQTDLIQLKEGDNQISIQYQYPSGRQEEHVLNVKAGTI
jgi:hypothetical protein